MFNPTICTKNHQVISSPNCVKKKKKTLGTWFWCYKWFPSKMFKMLNMQGWVSCIYFICKWYFCGIQLYVCSAQVQTGHLLNTAKNVFWGFLIYIYQQILKSDLSENWFEWRVIKVRLKTVLMWSRPDCLVKWKPGWQRSGTINIT